jgi:hypothetical protein
MYAVALFPFEKSRISDSTADTTNSTPVTVAVITTALFFGFTSETFFSLFINDFSPKKISGTNRSPFLIKNCLFIQ